MIDPKLLKTADGLARIRRNLEKRFSDTAVLDKIEPLFEKHRALNARLEKLQSQRNSGSKEIGQKMAAGEKEAAEKLKGEIQKIGEQIKELKGEMESIDEKLNLAVLELPNLLDESVPEGEDDSANVVLRESGSAPKFSFEPKPHYELASAHNYVDFERGVKLAGSRFYVYNEQVAKLERELIRFMLNLQIKNGYLERTVPLIVNDESMIGTGQLPKFAEEFYRIEKDALNLIPTAEVPLTNLYRDEILSEQELPVRLTSATACFRREAGAAGRDTRGLIRVHQFQKVELVTFCKPEDSAELHEQLTSHAESVLQALNLQYRVVLLCSGDTSASSSKTYDLEVFMPGLNRYLEISSCSNFRDYQARRAKIRYKDAEKKKNVYLHTLNGSGVAAGRLVAALMEYHQREDLSVDFDAIYALLEQN